MLEQKRDIVAHESYLARRVGELFRLECAGCLARRPAEVVRRLLDRRGELIDALIRADAARRNLQIPISPELKRTVEMLWQEVGMARREADARLDALRDSLAIALGDGIPSGVRGVASGRILGQG
jgi:hypothetical protein